MSLSDRPPPSSSVGALASRWVKTLPTLRVSAVRVAYLRAEILRFSVDEVAMALNDVAGSAEQADPVAREVIAALVPLLTEEAVSDRLEALRQRAKQAALLPLDRLLRGRARSHDTVPPSSSSPSSTGPIPATPSHDPRVPKAPTGRPLTLGERKALARRPSRVALEQMMKDPHPLVIRNLLVNPKLTEDDVLRLVARRPGSAEVILEVARHPAWSQRARVRMAIIQNPATPPDLAVPLVRLLIRPELLQVIGAVDVPAVVRAAASELLERRPPVPEPGDKGLPQ